MSAGECQCALRFACSVRPTPPLRPPPSNASVQTCPEETGLLPIHTRKEESQKYGQVASGRAVPQTAASKRVFTQASPSSQSVPP